MVLKRLKIVNKSPRKKDLLLAIEKIMKKDFDGLDISAIAHQPWYYRCRVWTLRIVFYEKDGGYIIDKVGYRWDVYKWL